MMKAEHSEAIDVGRGIAALAVTAYHYKLGHSLAKVTDIPILEAIDLPGTTIAVPLFFFISGFCIHNSAMKMRSQESFAARFLLLRFFRIYPPLVLAVIVTILVSIAIGKSIVPAQIFSHLTLTNSLFRHENFNVALWSVSVEAMLYCIYPIWLGMRTRHGMVLAYSMAAVLSMVSLGLCGNIFPNPTGREVWFVLNVFVGWISGALLSEIMNMKTEKILLNPSWWLAGAAMVAISMGITQASYGRPRLLYLLVVTQIMLGAWIVSALLLVGNFIQKSAKTQLLNGVWRFLASVGAYSYSLYLLHVPLQQLRFLVHDHLIGYKVLQYIVFLSWFLVILSIAKLSYRFVERPSINYAKGWLKRTA